MEKMKRDYQVEQDSGGVKPGQVSNAPIGMGSSSDNGLEVKRTVSTVGHVKQRSVDLDKADVPSGRSDIDPGGAEWSGGKSGKDQD